MDVAICTGKSCRKRTESGGLRDAVAGVAEVVDTSCLSICKGPVVVVDARGDVPLVLARVRSPKAIRDVRRVVDGGEPSRRLRERSVTGGKRAKAIQRAARSLRRRRASATG
jgi:(2Fe-2S) ferredoxin